MGAILAARLYHTQYRELPHGVLTEKPKLKHCFNMKYCLYEGPQPKKQDYKDRFRSRCLFLLTAASQILEILYLVAFYTNL